MKAFTVGSVYTDKLRREVQDLSELFSKVELG
jgi:hypothetical protein